MEMSSSKLFHLIIRVPKEDSAFFYFLLESHEGLAFYSTLHHKNGQDFRDIDMKGSYELLPALETLIDGFHKDCPSMNIIHKDVILE